MKPCDESRIGNDEGVSINVGDGSGVIFRGGGMGSVFLGQTTVELYQDLLLQALYHSRIY